MAVLFCSQLLCFRSKYEKFDLKQEYKKRQDGKDMLNMVVIGNSLFYILLIDVSTTRLAEHLK